MPLRKVSHKLEIEKYNTVKTNKQLSSDWDWGLDWDWE